MLGVAKPRSKAPTPSNPGGEAQRLFQPMLRVPEGQVANLWGPAVGFPVISWDRDDVPSQTLPKGSLCAPCQFPPSTGVGFSASWFPKPPVSQSSPRDLRDMLRGSLSLRRLSGRECSIK